MTAPARSARQRQQETLHRLENDVDAWVATAGPDGGQPYLIPLSFLWDGRTVLVATPSASVTARNLLATGRVRLGIGTTRDVVSIDGTVEAIPEAGIPNDIGDAFAVKTGFDPRRSGSAFHYFRIVPQRVQAWREENELAGREIMRDGRWLIP